MTAPSRVHAAVAAITQPARRAGCTRETKRCDFWNWGVDNVRPECCTEHLKELIAFVDELLARHRIAYWLDFGTLLGAVREGAFIPWDGDADLGILSGDAPRLKALFPEIEAAGYHLNVEIPYEIRIEYSRVNELSVDLFLWHERDGLLVSDEDPLYAWPGVHNRTGFPKSFVETLERVELYGRTFPAPSAVDRFLRAHRYGADYMTPMRPVTSVKLYPSMEPDDLTPAAKRLLARIAERDEHLLELKSRSRLSQFRVCELWTTAGLPLAPKRELVDQAAAEIAPTERSPAVEALIHSLASLEQAIAELERPAPGSLLRRIYRRAVRAKEVALATLQGRPHHAGFPYGVAGTDHDANAGTLPE